MIDKTIPHYKILEKLDESGMSVVYKAEDPEIRPLRCLQIPPATTWSG